MAKEIDVSELNKKARKIRREVIRMLTSAGSGHPGGSLSAVDIFIALYFCEMQFDPKDPCWPDRDRFILSKGHAAPVLYAVLAEMGYFPKEELMTLRQVNSRLQGHPDCRLVPGVEMSTGSLGQGLSVANGLALGLKLDKKKSRVYVLLGDGEIQEGQVWEAAMTASHYKNDNLTAIIDRNGLQIDGHTEEIMGVDPITDKWKAFGWEVFEVDGHNIAEIAEACEKAKQVKNKPTIIVAYTVKGKGVSFMEGKLNYHGVAPTKEEEIKALKELGDKE